MIKLSNVTKLYPPDITALANINLEIKEGEFVSVVGRSGAGKTTLVKLLVAEEKPTSGKIEVLGWDITQLKPKEISYYRRKIGVVFQDFKLLESKTAYENVAFALMVQEASSNEIKQKTRQALALVGLGDKEKRFPKEMSGGERQRLAIARAFVHRPKILLADELTGDLDAIYAWEIAEILLKINKLGTTILLSTHDRDIVNRLRRRVIVLEEGKIIRDQKVGTYLI